MPHNRLFLLLIFLSPLLIHGAQADSVAVYTSQFTGGEIKLQSIKRTSDDTVLVKGSIKSIGGSRLSLSPLLDANGMIVVKLQDLKTKREFQPVEVGGRRVAAEMLGVVIEPGMEQSFWARVTAPPADTTNVTVIFKGDALPIDGAPVTE